VSLLRDLVAIPSVSFAGFDPAALDKSAALVARRLEALGAKTALWLPASRRPAVFGALGNNPSRPTVLLYAHHDVQPPLAPDLWKSPAFALTERDGRLYGRGAADDKAGIVVHLAAAQLVREALGEEAPNLRLLIEGEEEVASEGLAELLALHGKELAASAVIVADGSNFATGEPALAVSLRGMVALSVEVRAFAQGLHSGLWSGPLPDPALGLAKMLASLTDDFGEIAVKGLSASVKAPTEEERQAWQGLNMDGAWLRHAAQTVPGLSLMVQEKDIAESLWRRPAITVTNIQSGSRESAGNVLQPSAWARVSLRLAPGMDAQTALYQLREHLRERCPWGLELHLGPELGRAEPWMAADHPAYALMKDALSEGYGAPVRALGNGASIPAMELFGKAFPQAALLLTGVEDPQSAAHAPNESLAKNDLRSAILSEALFLARCREALGCRDSVGE
jgi:acetylornithine deacetylase/succinyl-diaminopimelate desuccinylase-like protein